MQYAKSLWAQHAVLACTKAVLQQYSLKTRRNLAIVAKCEMAHCSDTIPLYIRNAVFLTATVEACNIISFILRHLRKLCIASGKPRCHAAASNVKGTLVIVSLLTHMQAHSST